MTSHRRMAALIAGLLGAGAAAAGCINTTDPILYGFRYQVGAFGCDTSCAVPDTTTAPIDSVARGDTVWVLHALSLVAAIDSLTVQVATLRPDCEQNVVVLAGSTVVRTLPTPTCPDSTYHQGFQLAGIDYPQLVVVATPWVVDSTVAPGLYGLKGRVLAQPRLEPVYTIRIR